MSHEVGSVEGAAQVLIGHTSDISCVDFSQSNLLASSSNDKSIRFWKGDGHGIYSESKSSPPLSPFTGHKYAVNCVRFSPFDTILASCSTDGNIILWDAQVSSLIHDFWIRS